MLDDQQVEVGIDTYDLVLTNPPFGKKSSVTYITEDGEVKRESQTVVRDDFWTSTSNKQLNFVQHVKTLLQIHGRAAGGAPYTYGQSDRYPLERIMAAAQLASWSRQLSELPRPG